MGIKSDIKTEFMGYHDVKIICPICKTNKVIQVPEGIIKENSNLTTIQIPKYRVCDHIIIPFIDKNFNVRGYQKVDYIFDLYDDKPKVKIESINLFSIKLNIEYILFVNVLYSVFHRYNVLILIDDKLYHKKQDFNNLFNYIFDDYFKYHINVELKRDFKKKKDIYKGFLILDGRKIKNIKIDNRDLFFETTLIKEFYKESDDKKSIINLKDRIREVNIICQKIIKINQKEGKGLRRGVIINHIEKTHFIRISKRYFNFLIEVIKNYYNFDIILAKDLIGEKLSEMWGR